MRRVLMGLILGMIVGGLLGIGWSAAAGGASECATPESGNAAIVWRTHGGSASDLMSIERDGIYRFAVTFTDAQGSFATVDLRNEQTDYITSVDAANDTAAQTFVRLPSGRYYVKAYGHGDVTATLTYVSAVK